MNIFFQAILGPNFCARYKLHQQFVLQLILLYYFGIYLLMVFSFES